MTVLEYHGSEFVFQPNSNFIWSIDNETFYCALNIVANIQKSVIKNFGLIKLNLPLINAIFFITESCNEPLGMESGAIPDDAISASSSYVQNVGPKNGR